MHGSSAASWAVTTAMDTIFTYSGYDIWEDTISRNWLYSHDRALAHLLEGGDKLLIANSFRGVLTFPKNTLLGRWKRTPFRSAPTKWLRPVSWSSKIPSSVKTMYRQYGRLERMLKRRAEALGMNRPLILTSSPYVAGFCNFDWAGGVVYYAYDDFAAYKPIQRDWAMICRAYAEISKKQVAVVGVSQAILDRIQPTAQHMVLPNGVDAQEWERSARMLPDWFAQLPKPRLLYLGALDDRLHLEQAEASLKGTNGSLALVGPLKNPDHFRRFRGRKDVFLFSNRSRADVVEAVKHADLCLLPHHDTPLTKAMSPLKLYEYLAAGRPVVASPLPATLNLDEKGLTVTADFETASRQALSEGANSEEERIDFIRRHSWDARMSKLMNFCRDVRVVR